MANEVYVVGGARTPMADYVGALKDISALELGAIASAALMLETLGLKEEAAAIDAAILKAVKDNKVTPDIGWNLGTREAGDAILRALDRSP